MTTGYQHPGYARSFSGNAQIKRLEHSGGWLLRRPVNNQGIEDLCNAYPMFVGDNVTALAVDLAAMDHTQVASIILRSDPFDDYSITGGLPGFDIVRPFKHHYIASLERPWRSFVRKSSRKVAARVRQQFEFSCVPQPSTRAHTLWQLHQLMLEKQGANKALWTSEIIAAQLVLPGVTVFEVSDTTQTHAIACFMAVADRVYAHLLGVTEEGRAQNIIHGIYAYALDYFRDQARYIDFGSNAGLADDPEDGLSCFKQGWCSETRTSYLCGKILNPSLYTELCYQHGVSSATFFPAYRTPKTAAMPLIQPQIVTET